MNPHQLDNYTFSVLIFMGLFGYYLFRAVNDQKYKARKSNGNCIIWGKKADIIHAKYTTSDGKTHESILLCSGNFRLRQIGSVNTNSIVFL
jgi:7-dehydrocholesterol reductase